MNRERVLVRLDLNNESSDNEEIQENAKLFRDYINNLLSELSENERFEFVKYVDDKVDKQKGVRKALVGILQAEVSLENFIKLIEFIGVKKKAKNIKIHLKLEGGQEFSFEITDSSSSDQDLRRVAEFADSLISSFKKTV